MSSPIKSTTPVLKISTYIIANISASPVGLAPILAIMSVSTFKLPLFYIYIYIYIGQWDVKHGMSLPIKKKPITLVLKVSTSIFTSTCLDIRTCCYSIYIQGKLHVVYCIHSNCIQIFIIYLSINMIFLHISNELK